MTKLAVVSFGCPRSGTTFLFSCLQSLPSAFVTKLPEWAGLHPCQSSTGLLQLADVVTSGRRLVLVRIKRNPMDIVESFLAARRPEFGDGGAGIARHTDREIVAFVRTESTSLTKQRVLIGEKRHVRLVEVKYEDLARPDGQAAFISRIRKATSLKGVEDLKRALQTFGKKPVRKGRLSTGIGRSSTAEQRSYFRSRLSATMEREGYV